jgi:uncharacterized protein YdeI (BOF family)
MKRALAVLAMTSAALLTAACADEGGSGDANPPNQQTQMPGPAPTE